jgi:hypothetical protein
MEINIHFWLDLAHFFLEIETFQNNFVEKIKIHILCSILFLKILLFMR